jgi:uncharacterized protein YndB with AHSA1/START domain
MSMPIRKDDTGKRWVEMELLVPGTPEQVWQAMATGAGNTAWFTRTQIEERVDGAIRFDFGPNGSSAGEIVTWEPPLRFGYIEREWNGDAPPVATEITVTARAGGRCVVRMVHSLFASSDEWDDQIEGFESGWPAFFEVLRVYLAHFAGREAASFIAMTGCDAEQPAVWARLGDALQLAGANVGDRRTAPAQSPGLAGVVEYVRQDAKQRFLVMRLDAPSPGIALIGTSGMDARTNASLSLYLYGGDAQTNVAALQPRWEAWLRDTLM